MALESILTFAAEGILTKVASLVAQEFGLALGFKDELAKLGQSLSMVQSILADVAEQPEGRGRAVEDWVKKLKDVAQDADDLMGELQYEDTRRKVELQHQYGKKVRDFFSSSNHAKFRFKMAHKIKAINATLLELKTEASTISLFAKKIGHEADVSQRRDRVDRETDSFFEKNEKVVGREGIVSDIVTTLINTDNKESLSVMAIVGMGGLGKTTLAKSVYSRDEINKHFGKKIWVCVSDPFDVNAILSKMLESLDSNKVGIKSRDVLLTNLQRELNGEKLILILDDVWNEDAQKWGDFKICLSKVTSTPGNSIIVTTRGGKVASVVETLARHDLAVLTEDECWRILKDRALPNDSVPITSDLEEIGRRIAKKCGGIPLMAKVLGSMMHNKSQVEWLSIQQSRIWDSPEEEKRIMLILKLSFDNLKLPSLKECFAYCSNFEKDFQMEKNDLIQLWMALGWLHPSPNQNHLEMEDIGDQYFNILAENSLFQDIKRNKDGEIVCKMHDLVHDLAENVSRSESLAWYSNKNTKTPEDVEDVPISIPPRIRSAFLNGRGNSLNNDFIARFRALRVLKMAGTSIAELPISIGELKLLRYLDVSYTGLRAFPKSIGKLYNLQTLRMMGLHNTWIPKEFHNLIYLRHLCFSTDNKNWAHLPTGIGRLTNLRTLPGFAVDKEAGLGIEELASLNQLGGELFITQLGHVRDGEEAKKANLVSKKNIRKMVLQWEPDRWGEYPVDVLEGLQPCPKLEYLVIWNFRGAKFPSWLSALNNLKRIELKLCCECERLPTLCHLPNLNSFKIFGAGLRSIGAEFYCYASDEVVTRSRETRDLFPALKTFDISYCTELVEWVMPADKLVVFPRLEKLSLSVCSRLKTITYHFPSLQELEIKNCEELTSVHDWVQASATLQKLKICECPKLRSIPSLENFRALSDLTISCCNGLTSLPSGLSSCTSLQFMLIERCHLLKSIPSLDIKHLFELKILECEELQYLPSVMHLPRLKKLSIGGFREELDLFPNFSLFSPLEALKLEGWPKLKSLPQQFQHLTSLMSLTIYNFDGVEALPEWLGNLTFLRNLAIENCENLKYLPSVEAMKRLTQLEKLWVFACPLLKQRCTHGSGPEWHKISHIEVEYSSPCGIM